MIASGDVDKSIILWDTHSGSCLQIFSGHSAGINSVSFSKILIASGSEDKTIKIWEISSGKCL